MGDEPEMLAGELPGAKAGGCPKILFEVTATTRMLSLALRVIPLRAIPLRAIPLRAIPLRAILFLGMLLLAVFGEEGALAEDGDPRSISIPLQFQRKLGDESHGYIPLFQYGGGGKVHHEGVSRSIVPPALGDPSKVAYGFVYFTGQRQGALTDHILVLVDGYQSEASRFFVDLNNNLDLTDDGAPDHGAGGAHELTLKGSESEGRFSVRLWSLRSDTDISANPERLAMLEGSLSGFTSRMGGVPVDSRHWFADQRLNVMSSDHEFERWKFQIGLHDANCNGSFGDIGEDQVLVGEFGGRYLSRDKSDGATRLSSETLIQVGSQTFLVTEVDSAGGFVRVELSDRPYTRLKNGADLPEFELTMMDGSTASLASFVEPGKFLWIDFWGHWCRPCVEALPIFKQVHALMADQVTILGLHNGDHDEARKLIEEQGLEWPQAEASRILIDAFLVDHWPYGVLVTDEGKILKLNADIPEVLAILQGGASEGG